jgi:hypothetical protein
MHRQPRLGQGRSDGTPPFHPLNNPTCPTYAGSISQSEKRFSGGLVRTTLSHSLHIQAKSFASLHVKRHTEQYFHTENCKISFYLSRFNTNPSELMINGTQLDVSNSFSKSNSVAVCILPSPMTGEFCTGEQNSTTLLLFDLLHRRQHEYL